MLLDAQAYAVLDVAHHTSAAYAELKTNLAKRYLVKASRRDRPRWLEEWVDKTTGQRLQVDENDLWMCAQVKERDLILVTADDHMRSEEHTSELQSLMRISYAVFCLKKKKSIQRRQPKP